MGGGATRERGRPARMHSRSVPVGFPARRHLPETNAGAQCRGTGSKASTGKFSIHIDAQDAQDFFSGDGRGAGTRANGSLPKGVLRLSEKWLAG